MAVALGLCGVIGLGTVFIGKVAKYHLYFPYRPKSNSEQNTDVDRMLQCKHGIIHVRSTTPWKDITPNHTLILYFHGNASNIDSRRGLFREMTTALSSQHTFPVIVTFDYVGFGHSRFIASGLK